MKKPIFPRIIVLFLIYGAFFLLLAMLQFSRQGAFTHKIGHFVVSGHDWVPMNPGGAPGSGEYLLTQGASVFFGGVEFRMDDDSEFALRYDNGDTEKMIPEYMILSEDTAFFRLPGGSGLSFFSQDIGGSSELRISGSFDPAIQSLELPYRLLRASRIRDAEDGTVFVLAGGLEYSFGPAVTDSSSRILSIGAGGVSYRVVPEKRQFIPDDLIIPAAQDIREYENMLNRWRDQSFTLWSRSIGSVNDEELINAYLGESVRRGLYRTALPLVSPGFLNGERRTFESAVYLGRLDVGLRSISAYDREKTSRLSRQASDRSLDFLREFHVFEYLSIRNNLPIFNNGIEMVRDLDLSSLSLDISPGILEGWYDWHVYRPFQENPFDRLVEQAYFVIFAGLRKSPEGDRVFVFSDTLAHMEFNLRVGKALAVYGETAKNESWAALGRSLILSVLSTMDSSGMLPETLTISTQGQISADPRSGQFNSVRLYRILVPESYPHAVNIGPSSDGIWAWTAAAVSSDRESNILDISVSFPAGDTHYMMIRGIRPFSKIQLYGIDYRTDPQFERYDSSGWSYSSSEQTLLIKMRHRDAVEHIRIFS
jgi:hypothetical protein